MRAILLAGYAILLPIALFYRIRSQWTREKLDRKKEGVFILATLRPMAALFAAAWIAWLVDPELLRWSAVPVPLGVRYAGLILWLASGVLWIATFVFLGRNLTDTVVTRKVHTLVTGGPYRWVRHPFYVAILLHMTGAALITGNAFLLATGAAVFSLLALRTRREEDALRARFEAAYVDYRARTGAFLPRWRSAAGIALLLALLTAAAYGRAAQLGFVSVDDPGYVTENPHVQAGLTRGGVAWALTANAQSNWHPLTWLSLMGDASIGGSSPEIYHLTNVVLHILATVLVFGAFHRATGATLRCAAVAALFAVHPLHVESVAWISERKDVLSAVFWMLAVLAYVGYAERKSASRYALVIVLFALGLMAKPMLVTLPIVLLLLDRWPLRRFGPETWRGLVLEKLPLLALSALSSGATLWAQQGAVRSFEMFPLSRRISNALVTTVVYLGQMVWPARLAAYYPQPADALPVWQPVLAALLLLAVTFAAIRLARSQEWVLTGWGWYLITLVPVIGIVQVGSQARADRYTYIPLVGIFVILSWGTHALLTRFGASDLGRKTLAVASAAVIGALAVSTFVHLGYWKSTIDLFQHAVAVTEGNAVAHATLASALVKAGRKDEATAHLQQAMRLQKGYAEFHFVQTRVAIGQGRLKEASLMVRLELDTYPGDVRALVNAGLLDMHTDRYDDAVVRFEQALAVDPNSIDAHLNLGSIRAAQGRLDEAIAHFETVTRIDPNDPDASRVLAELVAKKRGAP